MFLSFKVPTYRIISNPLFDSDLAPVCQRRLSDRHSQTPPTCKAR